MLQGRSTECKITRYEIDFSPEQHTILFSPFQLKRLHSLRTIRLNFYLILKKENCNKRRKFKKKFWNKNFQRKK